MFGRVVFVATLCVDGGVAWLILALGAAARARRLSPPRPLPPPSRRPSGNAVAEEGARRRVFSYREIALRADGRGQYAADTLVNGMPVRMLVDTGASDVVVSASTAARLGLVRSERRSRTIQTANGRSRASPAVLTHVSFGGLIMNDVEALILAPEAGEVNLLGESFLKRLVSVEQRDGMLILRQ